MLLSSNSQQPLTQGLTKEQWVELLQSDRAKWAMKSLNYYDGLQLEEVIKVMNETRKDWKSRGFIPRIRNLTAAVVDKSGLLFKDGPPTMEVYANITDEEEDPALSQKFSDLLHSYNAYELFAGVDAVTRLLKTALVLCQYDSNEGRFFFDVLHRGNCEVLINPTTRSIEALIYRYSHDGDACGYRIITSDEVIDLLESKGNVAITAREPNPFGFVPAAVFYDTRPPRSGFWVEAPHDLVGINELVNLHLTDSEFALTWAKRPTLFTNMAFKGGDERTEIAEVYNSPLPRVVAATPSITGGPGQAVIMNSMGVDGAFIKYEGPDPKLGELNDVVEAWIKAFAQDWSVRIDVAGTGRASSGFQLVVEELPNLELRKQRGEQFGAGMRRFYTVIAKTLTAIGSPIKLPEWAYLDVEFPEPALPLDEKEQEEVWTMRIEQGRATVIDYFMSVEHMTKEEAIAKYAEIQAFKVAPPVPNPTLVAEENSKEDATGDPTL